MKKFSLLFVAALISGYLASGIFRSVLATADRTGGGGAKVWACKAGNGKYACSPGNKPDLTDVTATGGDCDYDYTDALNAARQVDPSWCGKTDVEIRNMDRGEKPPVDGGKTPSAGSGQLAEFLFNPLPVDSLTGALLTIAKGFLGIIALWGVVFVIIGGFKLTMAQGHEEAYLEAKKTITWAVLGVVVAALSFSIIAIVQNLLQIKVPEPPKSEDNGAVINKQ